MYGIYIYANKTGVYIDGKCDTMIIAYMDPMGNYRYSLLPIQKNDPKKRVTRPFPRPCTVAGATRKRGPAPLGRSQRVHSAKTHLISWKSVSIQHANKWIASYSSILICSSSSQLKYNMGYNIVIELANMFIHGSILVNLSIIYTPINPYHPWKIGLIEPHNVGGIGQKCICLPAHSY